MPFQKAVFKPGVNRETTNYANEGGWYDCDKVRFRSGNPQKIGGWTQYSVNAVVGTARHMLNWITLDGSNLMGVGTSEKYFIEDGGEFYDETPIRVTFTQNNPFTTTTGSSTVTLTTSTSHGAAVGDRFFVTNASDTDGIPAGELNAEHVVVSTPTTTTLTFEVATEATSGTTGGGSGVVINFEVSPGLNVAISGYGWGAGGWGRGGWGSAATDTSPVVNNQLRLWSADTFGEDLVVNPRGLPIYYWDASSGLTGNRPVNLATLSGAADTPVACNIVMTSDERHVIAFGTNVIGETALDPLLIRWSSQEDPADWLPTTTNTAGELRLGLGSQIITAQQGRQEILVWTDLSLHSMKYLGTPFIYGIDTVSANISIMSPNAAITVNNTTYWMGRDKFFIYNGYVQTLPCSVRQYIFDNLDLDQGLQVFACTNEKYSEITWFYCSSGSYVLDKYVTFNYLENVWYYGNLSRTYWLDTPTRGYPFAMATDGYMYQHESGHDNGENNPPTAFTAYIESSDFDIGEGDKFSFIQRVIPDVSFATSSSEAASVDITVKVRNFPGANYSNSDARSVVRTATVPIDQYTNQAWIRLRGRQAAFRIESSSLGTAWELGATRLEIKSDGRR